MKKRESSYFNRFWILAGVYPDENQGRNDEIVDFGQPLGKGSEQLPSLIQSAGALISAGESLVLQGKLKKLFGLDTLDINVPPGEDEVSRSMVTIGKYLTPKLYVSLGRSLFTDTTLVTLRYSLSKQLEIEAPTGTESGATLFYRIEFR